MARNILRIESHGFLIIKPSEQRSLEESESRLIISEKKWYYAIENSNDAIMFLDDNGFFYCNKKTLIIFGCELKDTFYSKHLSEVSPSIQSNGENSFEFSREKIKEAYETGSASFEWEHKKEDGTVFPAHVLLSPIEIDGRKVIQATVRDMSAQKKLEDEIIEANRNVESLFLNAPITMLVVDQNRRIVKANYSAQMIAGKCESEMASQLVGNVLGCLESLDDPRGCGFGVGCGDCDLRKMVVETIEKGTINTHKEILFRSHFDPNNPRKISVSTSQIKSEGENRGLVYIEDITEKKNLEKSLIKSQSMEIVGQIAAGLAHDFNNLLSAIMGQSECKMMDLPNLKNQVNQEEYDSWYEYLLEIKKVTTRGREITRRLSDISRSQEPIKKELTLNEVIDGSVNMLRQIVGGRGRLILDTEDELDTIEGDEGQLSQIIMNLVINARDSIGENGGDIIIKTGNSLGITENDNNQYSYIEVLDNGVGIDSSKLEKIFKPHFTTKSNSGGTGLGLFVVNMIVENHGGKIKLETELNKGTSMKLYFPSFKKFKSVEKDELNEMGELIGNGEKILYVDDQDFVQKPFARILEKGNFNVFTAASSEEAITLAEKGLEIAIIDLNLENESRLELAKILREKNKDLKIMIVSGEIPSSGQLLEMSELGFHFENKSEVAEFARIIKKLLGNK